MTQKLWNIQETAAYLGIDHDEVRALVEKGLLPAYRIAGSFLRFDPAVVEAKKDILLKEVSSGIKLTADRRVSYTFGARFKDLVYFNSFYFISILIIAALLIFIFSS
ncbi:MAG: helix-turn-helix domain-containing protein [Candidatus Omnitrophota bacterium]